VGIDRSDDADVPPDQPTDPSADRADTPADGDRQPGRAPAETRTRQEYHADLRAATAQEQTEPAENGQQAKPAASWEERAEQFRWMLGEYKRRWPPEERPPVDRSSDPPGSWHGDSNRVLDRSTNERIEAECDRIAQRERETISPALRKVESCDPNRHLVGFEFRLKDRDGIKEKAAKSMTEKGLSAEEATSRVPDTIRYTLEYDEARYTQGVWADIARMNEQGFKLDILKNSWSSDQYKGINSQWIEPHTRQRLELQFHTRISFEAKQITHPAYERLRTHQADALEELLLEALQKKVTAEVPIPAGATDIPDYPERGRNA
jgi:hypothetical protein